MSDLKKILGGKVINPLPVKGAISLVELIDQVFVSYNSGRIREASQIFAGKMLKEDVTIGLSLAGALTPAGLGKSCVIPLMEHGFVDWIVTTGANLYHDIHFALGLELRQGTPFCDDALLKKEGVVRIYDIVFDYQVLLKTDNYLKDVFQKEQFQKKMGSAEMHYQLGECLDREERKRGLTGSSILASAYRSGIPVYSPSPGDSSIGMNCAARALTGSTMSIDINLDVNESAAIVYSAKKSGGKSGALILGGGAPKNFILQTEPHIQEVLGLHENGHDYFIQITDARPDTGGLSGATPNEAISWGKVNPQGLPDTVVAYVDTTIALPVITAYALNKSAARPHKRLYDKRTAMLDDLQKEYLENM
jgi:deoxyhypusine synthase